MLPWRPGTLSRQRGVSRQRVAAAPALLACATLSRAQVAQGWRAMQVKARERLWPPDGTRGTVVLQGLRPDASCRAAVARRRACQVAQGAPPGAPTPSREGQARRRFPAKRGARLAQGAGPRRSPDAPGRWRGKGRTVQRVAGSTVARPAPTATQPAYPQHPPPPQGLGCPRARVLGVCGRARGRGVTRAVGRSQGQETGALALWRQGEDSLAAGEVRRGERGERP